MNPSVLDEMVNAQSPTEVLALEKVTEPFLYGHERGGDASYGYESLCVGKPKA